MIAELGLRIRSDGTREAVTDLGRLTQAANRAEQVVVRSSRNMTSGLSTMGSGLSRLTPQIQNASFQIQDFAVQVGAGTPALRALSQQLPQLAGGFGVWGAAIGAAVAVGAGLAPMLLEMGEEAETAEDRLEALTDAVDKFRSLVDQSSQPIRDLREEFGSLAEETRNIIALLQELALARALDNMRTSLGAFRSEFEDAMAEITTFADRQTEAMLQGEDIIGADFEQAVRYIRDELGLTVGQAREVYDVLNELGTASGPAEVVQASEALNAVLVGVYGSVSAIPPELRLVAQGAGESAVEAARLQAGIEDAAKSAVGLAGVDLASGIGAGADAAARLASNMSVAAQFAAQFGKANAGSPVGGGLGFGGVGGADTGVMSGNFAPFVPEAPKLNISAFQPVKLASGGGRGGGGGISEAERELDKFRRSLEGFRTEEQAAAAAIAELEAGFAKFGGSLSPEQVALYGQGLADLKDQMADLDDEATNFGETLASAFPSLSGLIDDAAGSLADFARQLTDTAFQSAIQNLFGVMFGGGAANTNAAPSGGLLGGRLIPGILHDGGIAGMDGYGHGRSVSAAIFANAERYHSGGIAGLRANEVPAILERGERVIPNGGSAAPVINMPVTIENHSSGAQASAQFDGKSFRVLVEDIAVQAVAGPKGKKAMGMAYGLKGRAHG